MRGREFLDLACKSGLLHVNIGIESIHGETIKSMNKRVNKVDHYANMFANMRKRGISFSLNFIFGWDNEDMSVFPATLEFLERHKVPAAYFNVLTPTPGTVLFDRLKASPLRRDIKIARATHLMHLEENRYALYREAETFLRAGDLPATKRVACNQGENRCSP